MSRNEKRELFQEVAWMDAAGLFIMGGALGLLGGHMNNVQVMKWGLGIMLAVGFFVVLMLYFKQERERGLEAMGKYRFSTGK